MKVYKTCPICSKPFNPCRIGIATTGTFNWREVVCSFECGKEYLRRIEEEKQPKSPKEFADTVIEDVKKLKDVISEENDDIDESLTAAKSENKSAKVKSKAKPKSIKTDNVLKS